MAILRGVSSTELWGEGGCAYRVAYRVVMAQAAIAVIGAILTYSLAVPSQAVAALWGGLASVANGLLLAWRMQGGHGFLHHDVSRHLRYMYRSMLERFFVVMVLLAIGMGWLKLVPLAVLGGFVVCQITLVIARLLLSR